MWSQLPRIVVVGFASVALAACGGGGGGPKGSDNTVAASVAPTGTVSVYLNKSQSISITFGTSDGRSASALSVGSGLASLPVGWVAPAGGFECPVVGAGTTCTLALQYLPTAPSAGTFALGFSYRANNGVAKQGSVAIDYSGLSPTLELLAGSIGGSGNLDGTGATARFWYPGGVALDSSGTLYVADNTMIRKITREGAVTTLAGDAGEYGFADGTGAAARFDGISGIAVDRSGTLYVADCYNYAIRKVAPNGAVTTLAGSPYRYGFADGPGTEARFSCPSGIPVDGGGSVYLTDNQTVRKIALDGAVTTIAGTARVIGSADGTGPAAQFGFSSPTGIALDDVGTLYVADNGNHTIRRISREGVVTTLAGSAGSYGAVDGTGANARFFFPYGVDVDPERRIFVADGGNSTIRKINPPDVVTTLAGTAGERGFVDGVGAAARFDGLSDIAVDATGNLYVTDQGTIRKVTPAGVVTTILGEHGSIGIRLGTFPASLGGPTSIALRSDGQLLILDGGAILVTRGL